MGSGASKATPATSTFQDVMGKNALSSERLSALSELSPADMISHCPPGAVKHASLLSLTYECVLQTSVSTPENIRKLIVNAREFNNTHEIGGKISIKNPFADNYSVTQTIEGPVLEVVLLWNRIKADARVLEIVHSSYELRETRAHQSWGMVLEGSQVDWGKNFMAEHCKHTVLHHNKSKTVFIVEDMRTNKHYVMKEILVCGDNFIKLPCTNEYDVLKKIYANSQNSAGEGLEGRTGITRVPDVFHELVRISMVYPLYSLDLFNAINYNTRLFGTEGFNDCVIVTFLAQLLEALLLMKKHRIVHRDIKPENICVDENGNLVLIDFELAIILAQDSSKSIQTDNVLCGSSLYIAPETFQRLEYSSATDLWAVAIVACDLHSAKLPWKLTESMPLDAVGRTILAESPTKPSSMSDELWAFLSKVFVRVEDRISVEEAINEPIFANFDFITYEDSGDMTPGNVFNRHEQLEGIRELNRQESSLTKMYANSSSRKRFCEVQSISTSPVITEHRGSFAKGYTSPSSG